MVENIIDVVGAQAHRRVLLQKPEADVSRFLTQEAIVQHWLLVQDLHEQKPVLRQL